MRSPGTGTVMHWQPPDVHIFGTHPRLVCIKSCYRLGLRMGTRASIDESIFASTRVHFKYSVTCEVLYYRPRNETLV